MPPECEAGHFDAALKLYADALNMTIENYILKGNGNYGGSPACAGVWIENGNVKIENSLFEDNEVSSSTTTGAALYVETGNVEVVDCLFDNNKTNSHCLRKCFCSIRSDHKFLNS